MRIRFLLIFFLLATSLGFARTISSSEDMPVRFSFTRGEMLKSFLRIEVSTMPFPLLKGARGMFFSLNPNSFGRYQFYIPPTSFKGGENSVNLENLCKKINTLKFADRNLTTLPSKVGKRKELLEDSTYQLLQTIPITSTYLTTDNLQNIYVATDKGQIIKFDRKGNQQFEYNNNRLGQVGKIAVKNPLNILVYYPDLAVIIILDRTLSVIKELNLYDLDIIAPKGIALANDNNIWVYDEVTATLKKINPEGAILFESRNLNQLVQKQLNPSFLQEKNNEIYLSDKENGLFVFDAFGQLKQTIPIKDIDQFQVIGGQILLRRTGRTYLLDMTVLEEAFFLLPTNIEGVKMVIINNDLMYISLEDRIAIYQSK